MSFYDSASLVFLPSGGAGKDGKAYSIKPVPEYGNELVTNGGFDTDSYWTKETGWSIANGKATQDGSAVGTGGEGDLVSGGTIFQIGKTYLIKIDIVDYVSGDLKVTSSNIPLSANKDGSYYTYYTAATAYLHIRAGYSSFIGSIDNVSVKEVIVDGDFTFSRGSNLTATRVDSNGLIEKGRENLLLQSNQFDTTWGSVNTTETSGQAGYDGSSDAWLLSIIASGAYLYQDKAVSGVQTFSFFAKEGTLARVNVVVNASVNVTAQFDLANGIVLGGSQNITSSITSVGDGWYRCSVTYNQGTTSRFRLYPVNLAGGGTSGSIYIQDAQLEIGLTSTEYIESGATTGKAGLLEDSPRFDYSGGASCPSLLLEPSRTNEIGYSEYFGDSSWTKSAATITNNALTSPQGNNNASYLTDDTANNFHGLYTIKNISSIVTCSIFVKYDNKQFVSFLTNNNGASDRYAYFDLINKTTHTISSGLTASIEDVSGGWLRLSVTSTSSANGYYWWNIAASNSSTAYVGDGTGLVGIFGAQLEQGSYPTSYIPNHSGGSVTRELDHCFTSSNSVLEKINATYFLEVTPIQIASNNLLEVRANGSINNRILLQTSSLGVLRVLVRAQGSSVLDQNISGAVSVNTKVKIALKYTDQTNISVFVDGVKEIDSDLVIDFSPELNGLDLEGSATANNDSLKQHQFIFFPSALSNTDCEILTGTSYESFAAMATALNYTTYE